MSTFYPLQVMFISHKTGDVIYTTPPDKLAVGKFNKKLNDVGTCVITMSYTSELDTRLQLDDFIEVYIPDTDGNFEKFDTYLFRTKKISIDNNQIEYISVSGLSLNHLIERRILDTAVDSQAINGYVTFATDAHTILEHFADQHFINSSIPQRNYPLMSVNVLSTNTATVGLREERTELLPVFQYVANAGNTNFQIVRTTSRNLELQLGKLGSNKTKQANFPTSEYTTLSPNFGNIQESEIEFNRDDEKNVIYLLGEGEGINQSYVRYVNADTNDSFYNYIEFLKTYREKNSDYQNTQEFLSKAIDYLYENQQEINVSFNIDNFNLQPNIELGDIISFYWKDQFADVEIKEITININDNGTFKKDVKMVPNVVI